MAGEKNEGLKKAMLWVALLAVVALLAWGLHGLFSGKSEAERRAPKITIMPQTPPPPPPKEKKEPEPPKDQKEIAVPQAMPKPDLAQPSQELKMEGPAGNGPSAFGAGKITNEDLSKLGSGKGGDGGGLSRRAFASYASYLKIELQRHLGRKPALKQRQYSVEVKIWVAEDGAMNRFEMPGSTGDADMDQAIRDALKAFVSFSTTPPQGMPQPIRLKIVTAR
jgi:TonB family protein